ncbi:DegT/DnrJ/EryC1/StrS family aminotransferase [Candidatus Pacearchaeota archaeon]|nr:DegT/DnrJ/EryC1/StrS family aminotransferase [Candidatus Pacearchaeota archaeon]
MNKKINFFSLERQYKKHKKNILQNIKNVLDEQAFVGGHFVTDFEKNFSKYTKSSHTIACNSGTDALWMALKALDLKKDSIVLTTPFSFIASSSEIVAHGAHPVFIDIDKDTYNIDPEKIKIWLETNCIKKDNKTIHTQTGYLVEGILPVNLFGQCADYKKIREIAQEFNLWIIEDACQSIGATDNQNISSGNLGNIACFSFYPTKNLGAFGDGGCCTTNNEFLAERLIQIRNHGRKSHYNYEMHGVNSRLDAIQAVILDYKLNFIDSWNNQRREIAQYYNKKFAKLDFINRPKEINSKCVYHQYCVEILGENRDLIAKNLQDMGIGTNIYYPKSLDQIEFLNKDARLKTNCSVSNNLTQNILALPIWPELKRDEIAYVVEKIFNLDRGDRRVGEKPSFSKSI